MVEDIQLAWPSDTDLSPRTLRTAFGAFPSGVAAVAALVDGQPQGLTASSFTSVSLDPPLVSVCMAHTSTTWPILAPLEHIGLSVLSVEQERLAAALAAKGRDRFVGAGWVASETGAVLLHGSALWLDCVVHRSVPAGDHDIVLFEICQLRVFPKAMPLVFHGSRFRHLALEMAGQAHPARSAWSGAPEPCSCGWCT